MAQNTSIPNAEAGEKPKKVTKADFLRALDETNAILEKQIAEMRENQRQINAKNEEMRERSATTRKRIEAL